MVHMLMGHDVEIEDTAGFFMDLLHCLQQHRVVAAFLVIGIAAVDQDRPELAVRQRIRTRHPNENGIAEPHIVGMNFELIHEACSR